MSGKKSVIKLNSSSLYCKITAQYKHSSVCEIAFLLASQKLDFLVLDIYRSSKIYHQTVYLRVINIYFKVNLLCIDVSEIISVPSSYYCVSILCFKIAWED